MLNNYVKMAFKVFLRRKFFTFISLFAISFTLLVLMMATTFLENRYGPFPPDIHTDRTLGIRRVVIRYGENGMGSGNAGYGFLDRYMRDLPGTERMAVFSVGSNAVSYWNDRKIELTQKRTDGEFWNVYAFRFLEGGPYTGQDVKQGVFAAVINEATRERFFGTGSALGKTVTVDGQRLRIVGVVANVPEFRDDPFADIWTPITTEKSDGYRTALRGDYSAVVLAKSGSDFPEMKTAFYDRLTRVDLAAPATRIESAMDTRLEHEGRMLWGFGNDFTGDYGGYFVATMIALMVLFMLLPAINLVNINVSRIMERASEIGVRKAFGASSWTLVGQFVTENVLLTMIGGAIGFVLSWGALALIAQADVVQYAHFQMNYRVFVYALLLILFFGVLSGLYPARRMSRLHPVDALRGGVR